MVVLLRLSDRDLAARTSLHKSRLARVKLHPFPSPLSSYVGATRTMHSTLQQCSIHIHDVAGPVTLTLSFNDPCLQPPSQLSNTTLGRGTFTIIIVSVLILHYVIYTFPPWLRDHISPTEHVQRVVPSGRSPAVSPAVQIRTTSPAGLLQLFL